MYLIQQIHYNNYLVFVIIESNSSCQRLHHLQIQPCEVQDLQHLLCVCINLDGILFECRDFTDGSLLDSLHHVSDTSGNFVPQLLAGDDGDLLTDAFVDMEVMCETCVVFLNHNTSSLLHSLCSNTTHGDGFLLDLM